jgi:hypothetical protein
VVAPSRDFAYHPTTRLDDWQLELIDLSTGTQHHIPTSDIISLSGEVVPSAAGNHRLQEATLTLRLGTEDDPSISASALQWSGWQILHIVPKQATAHELWGLVLKDDATYPATWGEDNVRLLVGSIEQILHWRIVEDGSGGAIASSGADADDYAKDIVSTCWSGTDVSGNTRVGANYTMNVESDESACSATDGDHEESGRYVDDLAQQYDFAYALDVTFSGGSFTFEFQTKYPRGGADKTSGTDRVVINDLAGAVLQSTRHTDRSFFANAAYNKDLSAVEVNSTSITSYERVETKTEFSKAQNVATALSGADVKVGGVWKINQQLRGGSFWMTRWEAGDLVLRNNTRLGLSESNEEIAGVLFEFSERTERRLALQVRWGDRQARLTERMAQRSPSGGSSPGTTTGSPTESENEDEKVAVDSAATPGYLGAASDDGVLRVSSPLGYTDNGDYVTLTWAHLGFESLSNPGADRIPFWDNGESALKWLQPGTNLSISGTSLNASGLSISGTDNRAVRMDGTGDIQDSTVVIADNGNVTINGDLTVDGDISFSGAMTQT